ncbi:DUF5360 family protein [Paenibacillus sp. NEAU-GSW1]|uniref:DUF5360 family protein n=1 Tax=Paenibacillus sp. NEAU-GSW1 TaxID=2682486 RepID=UPI0012E0D955|nr:DUF5360 family protein [Paenibacillus sp. NEAU-GSW1]MUT64836.1 hypothetical protein [Paenibacillus sp. NEAU-GSW1]
MSKTLKTLMLLTDVGFFVYWTIVLFELIPKQYQYQDYNNEWLVAWNLSFIPLDLFISFTGLMSIYCFNKGKAIGLPLCIMSLSLTFCSGLQAIAYWGAKGDFDLFWWAPNLFLMIYPLFFLPALIKKTTLAYVSKT